MSDSLPRVNLRQLRNQAKDFNKLLGSSLDAVAAKNLNRKIIAAVKFDGTSLVSMLSTSVSSIALITASLAMPPCRSHRPFAQGHSGCVACRRHPNCSSCR